MLKLGTSANNNSSLTMYKLTMKRLSPVTIDITKDQCQDTNKEWTITKITTHITKQKTQKHITGDNHFNLQTISTSDTLIS